MSELRELYQEIILDHYRKPRNCAALEGASHSAEGHNPLCGDRIRVFLEIDNGTVKDVSFEGSGCAISTASASLMTELVKGRSVTEAETLFRNFHELMTRGDESASFPPDLDALEALGGVREYPIRIKCATLAWHTLHAALNRSQKTMTTE